MLSPKLTEPLNSTSLTTEGFGGFIRPTELERRCGRLMRSPEGHETETTATDAGTTAATTEASDAGAATETTDGGDGGPTDASTVLGSAAAEDGAGDDEGKGAGKDEVADTDTAAEAVVPEAYDLKLTVAGEDGTETEVPIDAALLEVATPTLKELGLTNEQANKVAGLVPKVQERLIQQQNDAFAETRTQWAKQAQDDPEIGGKNWKSTVQLSARALDHFVGPASDDKGNKNEFRQLLDDTGLGNHPAMIRFCRKVGEGLAEDGTLARGSEGPRAKPSRLEALYPDDVKK